MNWFNKIHELAGQEYERYLPSAFDGSLTLLEKVNKVIETLNQLVSGVNTVADYVDGHVDTQNEKIRQLRDDFEILKYWLENEGLEERTEQVLNTWFDNGRLAQIIDSVFNMKADRVLFEQFVLSTNQQLAQIGSQKVDKNGSGQVQYSNLAQDVREKFTGGNVAIVGNDSVVTSNLTDNAVTFAKRTKVGNFAKIMLTGDVPNFNTVTGNLTFPSDFRILVGLSYYSVSAQTVDFSAFLSTTTQILILFNTTSLALQVASPTDLSSASHEQSVLVANITNVQGRRRTPEMNCEFSVNNIPYIPDIERMLLSKAIPQTTQVVYYHSSGVLNNIQHRDSDDNTIRTDTFTFSANSVVEERLHNQTYTKITFTTDLDTLTTEVI